jgi:hypothetical protein
MTPQFPRGQKPRVAGYLFHGTAWCPGCIGQAIAADPR